MPYRSRSARLSKIEVVTNILEALKKAKITPVDFLLHVLERPGFASYHAPFYNSDKFTELLDVFWNNERGSRVMKDWLLPHAVDLVCDSVHSEMESASPTSGCPPMK